MEDFVNFSIAKKLKEKGFREPCLGWYYPFEVCGFDYKTSIVFNNSAYRGSNYKDMLVSHKDEKYIDAPTISQVLKWLRDEKEIHIETFLYDRKYSYLIKNITKICEDDLFHECLNEDTADEEYATCEQSILAGIEYCLDNLI